LIDRLDVLVRSLADEVAPLVDRPFALFGHSLGALVAFELASFLEADRRRVPEHLFVSACQAPSHLSDSRRRCHTLPDTEFRKHLRSIRGTSAEVFRNDDLMEMFVPILRADFKLLETYQLPRERPRLSCPITAIGGLDDLKDIPAHAIQLWEAHTAGRFARYMLPGDHFFIHAYEQHLMEVIVEELSGMQRGGALSLP
jgi:medium-chain acyl-[acyl-carrier-protein] hydrolase